MLGLGQTEEWIILAVIDLKMWVCRVRNMELSITSFENIHNECNTFELHVLTLNNLQFFYLFIVTF